MPRGTGMSPTKRLGQRPKAVSPEALAARLPAELRSLEGLHTPSDYQALRRNIADWLNQAAPGHGPELVAPVMTAVCMSAADYYRKALTDGIRNV